MTFDEFRAAANPAAGLPGGTVKLPAARRSDQHLGSRRGSPPPTRQAFQSGAAGKRVFLRPLVTCGPVPNDSQPRPASSLESIAGRAFWR
jgi:hypothetical protein